MADESDALLEESSRDELDDLFGTDDENGAKDNRKMAVDAGEQLARSPNVATSGEDEDYASKKTHEETPSTGREGDSQAKGEPTPSMTIPPVTRPRDLDCECLLLKIPPFLRYQAEEPFDPIGTVDQELDDFGADPDNVDAATATRMMATIRFRPGWDDAEGRSTLESNARLLEWEDGSMSLAIGDELFEVVSQDMSNEQSYLYQKHPGCMEATGRFARKLLIRPYIGDRQEHRKYLQLSDTRRIDEMTGQTLASGRDPARVKMATTTEDPEREKERMIRLQQEKLRARRKQEHRRRNVEQVSKRSSRSLSAKFLEEDDEYDANEDYFEEREDQDEYEADFIDDTELFGGSEDGETVAGDAIFSSRKKKLSRRTK